MSAEARLIDEKFITPVKDGSHDLIRTLYEQYRLQIFGFFYRHLGQQPEPAEDLTQDVFERALRGLGTFGNNGQLNFPGLAPNDRQEQVKRPSKSQISRNHLPLEEIEEIPDPFQSTAEKEVYYLDLQEAIAGLPEDQRKTVVCRFILGMDHEETAEALGVTIANSRIIQYRGIRRLKELLNPPSSKK